VCDRYELVELLSVGGMGRVYRALYRALDQEVAVKLIHPHLLGSEEGAQRLMVEARIAARLNHPNIVTFHNFGRTSALEGSQLLIVMELLRGPSLASVLRAQWPLPLERVVDVLGQVLGALGEAHAAGVVHRDVKPANIVLEADSAGRDHVKLVDFGIAKLETGRRVTRAGEVIGTPSYMSPEQAAGEDAGPSADLYAVGVMLFQMLTGTMPFSGPTARAVLRKQLSAERPDPREVAPEQDIPPALAEVCRRAIDRSPARRYATAQELGCALRAAAGGEAGSPRRAPSLRAPAPAPQPAAEPPPEQRDTVRPSSRRRGAHAVGPTDTPTVKTTLFQPARAPLPPIDRSMRLVGRAASIEWALERLTGPEAPVGVALSGRAGVGKTRLIGEIAEAAADWGAVVLHHAAEPSPYDEVSGAGLAAIVSRLVGAPASDPLLAEGRAVPGGPEALGLRAIFGDAPDPSAAPAEVRAAVAAALAWAARGAAAAVAPRPLLLAIDDLDRLDFVTQSALASLLCGPAIPGLRVIVTSTQAPSFWTAWRLVSLRVTGLTRVEADALLDDTPAPAGAEGALDGDIEPLYIEQLRRFRREGHDEPAPSRLASLVGLRLADRSARERRALQAIAVTGGGPIAAIARVLPTTEELYEALPALVEGGFIEHTDGRVSLAHALFGRIVAAATPAGALADLHTRVADALAERPSRVELRAHHALRGRPDFAAFLLVEEVATLRAAYGEAEGVIAALRDGLCAARMEVLRGASETVSAWIVFGHKLGAALVAAGRFDEGIDALLEVLRLVKPTDVCRALVLEQLALASAGRGALDDAEAFRREGRELAVELGDRAIAERLRRPLSRAVSGSRPQLAANDEAAGPRGARKTR
jgi:serine/threonine-protein kinase